MTSSRSRSAVVSLAVHTGAIALVLVLSSQIGSHTPSLRRAVVTPLIAPHIPKMATPNAMGGGGGAHEAAPATAGHLPKVAPRQFVPPTLEILNPHPKLAMEMSIEAPPDAVLTDRQLPNPGDPLSGLLNHSAGMGGPLGIGNGKGTGVGNKRGPGAGEGDGLAGTVYKAGNGVTGPVLVHSVEPEFSEDARRAKYTGTVTLHAVIDEKGHPRNLSVVRSLGMGLDEKATEAVLQWLFRPGTKDGKAVAVSALIEVSFHLL